MSFQPRNTFWSNLGSSLLRLAEVPVALTDRDTGTVYYLTSRVVSGKERLVLSTVSAVGAVAVTRPYAAAEGPFIYGSPHRLLIRAGRLGYETVADPLANEKVFWPSLTSWWTTRYEVVLPATFAANGRPAFQTVPAFGTDL